MSTQRPSATFNVSRTASVAPVEATSAHVIWCTCGVMTGGARDPRRNCPMHSITETVTWGTFHWTA